MTLNSKDAPNAGALAELQSFVDEAVAFAEHWQAPYRVKIFEFALAALLGKTRRKQEDTTSPAPSSVREIQTTTETPVGASTLGSTAITRLARALNCEVGALERVIQIDETGKIQILARLDGKSRRESQTRYSLVYCYVKEIGLGERAVDIAELRSLCSDHGCYDLANFTGNFRDDVKKGLIREMGEKGAHHRRYIATKRGLDEAAAILKKASDE